MKTAPNPKLVKRVKDLHSENKALSKEVLELQAELERRDRIEEFLHSQISRLDDAIVQLQSLLKVEQNGDG